MDLIRRKEPAGWHIKKTVLFILVEDMQRCNETFSSHWEDKGLGNGVQPAVS